MGILPYEKKMFGEMIHGIGEQTFQWIIHDVKPYIDSCYLAYGHREATGIAGSFYWIADYVYVNGYDCRTCHGTVIIGPLPLSSRSIYRK